MADFKDVFRLFRKLNNKEQEGVENLQKYLSGKDMSTIKTLIKQRKVSLSQTKYSVVDKDIHLLVAESDDSKDFVERINNRINSKINVESGDDFSKGAIERVQKLIAPNIIGLESIKKAAVLQLFAPDHIHLLLLGDPGTGKTDIIRSAADLHPVSAFGLGSGTSGAGLAVSIKGENVSKGLLPMADNGLCSIDELNLLKEENRAALYNAMEKGFITYDKAGHHYKFDARVSVLATANPKGDKFTGNTVEELKKQLPFDPALLTRFHLVFLIRKPDVEKFREIAKNIIKDKKTRISKQEVKFVQDYIRDANELEVSIPSELEHKIVDFVAELKKDEEGYLIEISPRLVVGFLRLAKAAARAEMRQKVEKKDIELVKDIVRESLKV